MTNKQNGTHIKLITTKEFDVNDKSHTVDEKTATAVANHLQFKGDVRESKSGKSWRCYRNNISNSFDLSAITI